MRKAFKCERIIMDGGEWLKEIETSAGKKKKMIYRDRQSQKLRLEACMYG